MVFLDFSFLLLLFLFHLDLYTIFFWWIDSRGKGNLLLELSNYVAVKRNYQSKINFFMWMGKVKVMMEKVIERFAKRMGEEEIVSDEWREIGQENWF